MAYGIVARRHWFADDAFAGRELVQARADQLPADVQDLGGLADQVGLGQVAVPAVGGLGQCVLQPRHDPLRAVVRDPDGPGDGIGGLEPDAPHLGRQPVGLVTDHRDGGALFAARGVTGWVIWW
jgi:hypothetical protein